MKELILAYFKTYQIDVDQLLLSGHWKGCLDMKDPKDYTARRFKLNYKISQDTNETTFFFWCRNDKQYKSIIHNFSNGFKNIAKASEAVIIEWPGPERDWYGWCDLNTPIGFGVRNEIIGFTMRILIQQFN